MMIPALNNEDLGLLLVCRLVSFDKTQMSSVLITIEDESWYQSANSEVISK